MPPSRSIQPSYMAATFPQPLTGRMSSKPLDRGLAAAVPEDEQRKGEPRSMLNTTSAGGSSQRSDSWWPPVLLSHHMVPKHRR